MNERHLQRGFSFIELVISLVLISIAVTGVLVAYTTTVSGSADPQVRLQAIAVAESYLEEILSRPFNDPDGIEPEASRASFDDVDDYNGLNEEPQLPDGTTLGLSAYTVTVSVGAATLNGIAGSLRVDVTVTHDGGESITLTGYRTDYGP